MSKFIYLLNAMEAAAQADNPAEHDYGPKRRAVLEYVTKLETAPSEIESPLSEPTPYMIERAGKDFYDYHAVTREIFDAVSKDDYGKVGFYATATIERRLRMNARSPVSAVVAPLDAAPLDGGPPLVDRPGFDDKSNRELIAWCEAMADWCDSEDIPENERQFTTLDRANWIACSLALRELERGLAAWKDRADRVIKERDSLGRELAYWQDECAKQVKATEETRDIANKETLSAAYWKSKAAEVERELTEERYKRETAEGLEKMAYDQRDNAWEELAEAKDAEARTRERLEAALSSMAEPAAWRCTDLVLKGAVVQVVDDAGLVEMRRKATFERGPCWKIEPLYAAPSAIEPWKEVAEGKVELRAVHALPGTQWHFWIKHDGKFYEHRHVLPAFVPPQYVGKGS